MDPIGTFKGKLISQMTREELLDFAKWAGDRIWGLEKIERETSNFRIERELEGLLTK